MGESLFFRLLKTPLDEKGERLAAQVAALNEAGAAGEVDEAFSIDSADLSLIPGSPFAYWVSDSIRQLFKELPPMSDRADVKQGLATADDFRFVRTWWEVPPQTFAYSAEETTQGCRWAHFAKGGRYSPFYADVHLLVDWGNKGERIRNFFKPDGRLASRPQNIEYFFRPGLTWPLRAARFAPRILPAGCIFSVRGYAVLAPVKTLKVCLAVFNSFPFDYLFKLRLGREGFPEFVVGVLQKVPWSEPGKDIAHRLATLAIEAHDLQRERDVTDETTHVFCLPGLAARRGGSLEGASVELEEESASRQARLTEIQAKIDGMVFDLYGLGDADRELVRSEIGEPDEVNEADDEETPPEDLPDRVGNLLMWCVGVAFGRWDVRYALEPDSLPGLHGPFDPLPRCAPGALVGPDGLPATRDEVGDYPLPIAWDGILVDDPTHPSDVVTRVREVLTLLWGSRAGEIEREACGILGIKDLRDYFRDYRRGFFAFHVSRYSKSRRKAPIYWLLQSGNRSYAIWLYCHRMKKDTLFAAGRDYADAKVKLEEARLDELEGGPDSPDGAARRQREREIDRQQKLVREVTEFRDRLDKAALLNIPPDPNDGVVISIAPLRELVPWKEAQKTWDELVSGKYPWSTMARQMRERGLLKKS